MSSQPGTNPLHHLVTKTGKVRSRYTLKCEWNDGNTFTHRSDKNLEAYQKLRYTEISELDALVLKFIAIRKLARDAKIFDNSKPLGEDVLLHWGLGRILKNNLPLMSNNKPYSL